MSAASPLQRLKYSALERVSVPRPVDRLPFLAAQVSGKGVFDLGALDETAIDAKLGKNNWLHARLCEKAAWVVGIDNSNKLPSEGMETGPSCRIIHADIFHLGPVIEKFGKPDVIVAGELIEHLPDTGNFLRSLRGTPGLRGVEFVFSTPNACSWHNALVGLAGRESMHHDHLQIYSYKTLRTLFARADIELVSLVPCHVRFDEMISSASGAARVGVHGFQRLVNTLEYLSPMLASGWIGRARL